MSRIICEKVVTSRKKRICQAFIYGIEPELEYNGLENFTFADKRVLVKHRQKQFLIMPGDQYLKITQVEDGDICNFAVIPELHEICQRLNLYND